VNALVIGSPFWCGCFPLAQNLCGTHKHASGADNPKAGVDIIVNIFMYENNREKSHFLP
jgi:hypothetical protein